MEWTSVLWIVAQIMVGEMMPVTLAAAVAAALCGWEHFSYRKHKRQIVEIERRIAARAAAA